MSGTCTQKKLLTKLQWKAIVDYFSGGVSISGLKCKRVGDSPQRKLISKKRWQEMERVAESEIVLNKYVFVSIFGREIEEKAEKYNQSGYCSSTIT